MESILNIMTSLDTQTLMIIIGIIVILLLISIIKKIKSLMIFLVVIGFIVGVSKPIAFNILKDNGITISGSVITIDHDSIHETIDCSLVQQIDTTKDENKTVIHIKLKDDTSKTIQVSNHTMKYLNIALNVVSKITQFGYHHGQALTN